jgi:hypothetical protein
MNRPGHRIVVQNWSISNRTIVTAGLFAALAVTTVGVAAQAPVQEPRPAVERQPAPLIVPPGTQRSEQARPPEAGQQRQGATVVGPEGTETVPFRPPVLDTPAGGEAGLPDVPDSLSGIVLQLQ